MSSVLTVIIPTRNEKLENLIAAVFSQHPRIAYYLHFDEPDEVFKPKAEWVKNKLGHRTNVHIVQERCGLIEAQNKGVDYAISIGSPYVIYQHGHDWIGSGVFALMDFLDENPDYSVAYGSQQYKGIFTHRVDPEQLDPARIYEYDFFRNAVCYRASAVKAVGGFIDIYEGKFSGCNEEYSVNIRLIESGHKYKAIKTESPALYFTIHPNGITHELARRVDEVDALFRKTHPKWTGKMMVNPKLFEEK
jgi:hypothetical protein